MTRRCNRCRQDCSDDARILCAHCVAPLPAVPPPPPDRSNLPPNAAYYLDAPLVPRVVGAAPPRPAAEVIADMTPYRREFFLEVFPQFRKDAEGGKK